MMSATTNRVSNWFECECDNHHRRLFVGLLMVPLFVWSSSDLLTSVLSFVVYLRGSISCGVRDDFNETLDGLSRKDKKHVCYVK